MIFFNFMYFIRTSIFRIILIYNVHNVTFLFYFHPPSWFSYMHIIGMISFISLFKKHIVNTGEKHKWTWLQYVPPKTEEITYGRHVYINKRSDHRNHYSISLTTFFFHKDSALKTKNNHIWKETSLFQRN